MRLTGTGVWSGELRRGERAEVADAAAELDELGYSTLWIPGGSGGPVLERAGVLLDTTRAAAIATGILNVWMHEPGETAEAHARLSAAHPGRFVLGLGISHGPIVDAEAPGRYRRPLGKMRAYLDALDAASPAVPAERRVLAALGPRMLELARERSAGAHPYFVSPEHTRAAREILGEAPLLAPEQAVLIERDPDRARELARTHVARYLELPNYAKNLLRHGFGEEDLAGGGSDRLVDGIVAWGDLAAIRERVDAHRAAGADHVCIQVLGAREGALPRAQWRELAAALID